MKSYINKFFMGAAVVATLGFTSCVDDLDQVPQDPNVYTPGTFAENPREYLGGAMAKLYSGLAVSGQDGSGSSEIDSPDAGMSCYSRVIFMANEFTTDECAWIYSSDAGVADLVQTNWSAGNAVVNLFYSRLYTHIAVCNDFIRLTRNLGDYGISVDSDLQAEIDQFVLEARALRDYSYYNVIDIFGRAAVAWDDMDYGQEPPQAASRAALYEKVVADLEDVLSQFPDTTPVYGRIGKDAVEALLCRFYLNAEVFSGTPAYDKCWNHAQNIIARHKGGGFNGSGLANDYLSLFCKNNHIFVAGGEGAIASQNEILWATPYSFVNTESYGGTNFLIMAAIFGGTNNAMGKGFCNPSWYGTTNPWGCMHARQQFSQKFDFNKDVRTTLWLREDAGFNITNDEYANLQEGYLAIKFTNIDCNADGTMTVFTDPATGLKRVGNSDNPATYNFVDTDLPVIRLADVYLMAAECSLRGAGNQADGLTYANYIRERAGLSAWNAAEFTLNNLLDERARELYWENVRRTDLIRFGKFTGDSYVWNWKGGMPNGTYISSRNNVFPIPTNVISSYSSTYEQNPDY
jgi:hypothetical protein